MSDGGTRPIHEGTVDEGAGHGGIDAIEIRRVEPDEPWAWLAAGWRDFLAEPGIGLTYGIGFSGISLSLAFLLFQADLLYLLLPLVAGFLLLGPMLAVGLYETSRRRETGEKISLGAALFVATRSPTQLAFLGALLTIVLLVWIRVATLLYALFLGNQPFGDLRMMIDTVFFTTDGLSMAVVGTLVGGVIAAAVFASTAFSVPILMARDMDAVSAMIVSMKAVRANPWPMLVWAWLIVVLVGVGLATLFVGLAVTFPLIGHATWHAYRRVIG